MNFLAKKNMHKPEKFNNFREVDEQETQKLTQGRTMTLPQNGDVLIDTNNLLKRWFSNDYFIWLAHLS